MSKPDLLISNVESQCVLTALRAGQRVDLRHLDEFRPFTFSFTDTLGQVWVSLGQTRCLATVSATITPPRKDNGNEGILFFNVEMTTALHTMGMEMGRTNDVEVFLNTMLEKSLRRSRAIDTESLCIVADKKVWTVRVDIRILDMDGNIMDCVSIAAVTALLHFRRPEVTVNGEDVIVHTLDEKIPVPLTLYHAPICISFAFFDQGNHLVIDPNLLEDTLKEGQLTLAINVHREVCAMSMTGGSPLQPSQVLQCTQHACQKVQKISQSIKEAIQEDYLNKKLPFKTISLFDIKQS
ncbi:Exosome complex component RRP45 [Coelomomyces lativittatus]|nr:Exosome complex component RRP45 [Coelomomyces lativittatus]KAJ1501039.1 Exosome complex component RRP45 [Coelomomyces lativittatus]KAJ1501082.1 Exosome complex component RRP45 [Coelomomyces lativittatus]